MKWDQVKSVYIAGPIPGIAVALLEVRDGANQEQEAG
jgi:hypothetical protein